MRRVSAAAAARTNFFMMDSIGSPPVSEAGRLIAGRGHRMIGPA